MKKIINTILSLLIGVFLGAFSFNNLLLPHKLIAGGLGGIATIINRFSGFNIQLVLVLIFLPIAIWAYVTFGIKQIAYAFTCFCLFTIMIGLVDALPVPQVDLLIATVLSGVFFGISGGLVLRLGVANGPEALIGMYLRKKSGISIGAFFTILNVTIVTSSLLLPDATLNNVLYSMISIYISGQVTDYIVMGFRRDYDVTIISDKYIDITTFIHNDLKRGVTYIKGLGTYNLQKKMILKTLVCNEELIALKDYVTKIDPGCFMYVNESIEVVGRGFEVGY